MTYSVREILQWSSNVGAVKIGMKMGKERLLKWMDAFGFARPTGVDFPGEAAGIVPPADEWSGTSIANIPMGQGIAVTPLQMAVAFSTVANDGVAVKPRLIAQVGDAVYDDVEKHRVIPASVAREVRSMLATAVAEGTGTKAQIPGYEVAGKTGTAEKAASGRQRLLEDRLRGVVHRHGPRRPPAARGARRRGLAAHLDLRRRHRRAGRAEDHALRAAAPGDRAVSRTLSQHAATEALPRVERAAAF